MSRSHAVTSAVFIAAVTARFVSGEETTWYRDVKPIVDAYCRSCHGEGGVAPFAFDSYEQFRQRQSAIVKVIESRRMPPFRAEGGHTPLAYDTSLSQEQIDVIDTWFTAGGPRGDPNSAGAPIGLSLAGLDHFNIELEMPALYHPMLSPDEYRCFVFDWPVAEKTYFTGVQVMPGNAAIVHHAALYVFGPDEAHHAVEFETADSRLGYACFGGAEASADRAQRPPRRIRYGYLGTWVPGGPAPSFDNGVRVEPGSKLVLQMHYSTAGRRDARDRTRVRIQTAARVEREAFFLPWMRGSWPSGTMSIPAGEVVRHEYRDVPLTAPQLVLFAPGEDFTTGMRLHSSLLHMHKLGKSITLTLHHADGTEQVLVRVPQWEFNWQREYVFKEPVSVRPGDELSITCVFDNTEAWNRKLGRKAAAPSNWGEGTSDEMCVAHTRITHL